jgi:Asp-tRNA(Asn)/Glu-tRNA(Gln) amidotransferase A subunit family amidase
MKTNYLTATETQALLSDGKSTIDQILKDHKIRYQQRNDEVKAWACVDMTKKPISRGPLTGVVIGIKDIMRLSCDTTPLYCTTLTRRHL